MQLKVEQLAQRLGAERLAPVYLIAGDEPLQLQEALDAVRARARELGFAERTVLDVDGAFDWARLAEHAGALSLFAERRLLELRLSAKPGRDGSKALQAYAAAPPQDTLLLVSGPRLDRDTARSAWVRALDAAGVLVQVWPLEQDRFPAWLRRRAQSLELELSAEAAQLLAERVEGNALAAAQELEKLRLLHGAASLGTEQVQAEVTDSARYNVFDLADAMLRGRQARVCRVLAGLREEGVEPPLVLWAIGHELRALAGATLASGGRAPSDNALFAAGLWRPRLPAARRALARGGDWPALLSSAAAVDRVIKGAAPGDPWAALQSLALLAAGARVETFAPTC